MIPADKLSKKVRQEMNRQKREIWPMNPVTRMKESDKVYNRKRIKIREEQ